MPYLIDAQLPPSLAAAMRQTGLEAVHVAELGLATATDAEIWDTAVSRAAVLVTKDRDFSLLRAARNTGPIVLWIRIGNIDNRTLIARFLRAMPRILEAVERGETVVEFVGN